MIGVECLRNKDKLLVEEDEFEWYAVSQGDLGNKEVYIFFPEFYEKYKLPYQYEDVWVKVE